MIEILTDATPAGIVIWVFVVGWGWYCGVFNTIKRLRAAIMGGSVTQSDFGKQGDFIWYLCITYLCVFTFKLLG